MGKNIISISTKTGDTGTSGLANGERLPKDHLLFEVVGSLDELNSWLGLIAAKLDTQFQEHRQYLYEIQDTLFYIGAEIARSPKTKLKESDLKELERRAETLQQSLQDEWHTKFLLPGGTELGGYFDLARSVCRRTERVAFGYAKTQSVREVLLKYLNRLSDYLYLLRVFINHSVQYREQQFEVSD